MTLLPDEYQSPVGTILVAYVVFVLLFVSAGIEVMDLICKAGIGVAEGFCRGNIIKYILRAPNSRTPAEDYAKAEHYARMLKNLEKRSTWRSEEEDEGKH